MSVKVKKFCNYYYKFKLKFKQQHRKLYKIFLHIVGFTRDKTSRNLFKLFQIALYAILIVMSINLLSLNLEDSSFGTFGDFFGGVLNPILTFLTFMGLLITIIIQQSELKESRKEFKRSADALIEQSNNTRKQNFENTFFNMIDLHNKIVDDLRIDLDEIKVRKAIDIDIKVLNKAIASAIGFGFINDISNQENKKEAIRIFRGREVFDVILKFITIDTQHPKEIINRYKEIQIENNHIVGHYFRNLYQILKTMHNTELHILTIDEKRKYSSILRAQLSTKELAVLSINCLEGISDSGEFKNLLIEYSMLEHIPLDKVDEGYSLTGTKTPILSDDMIAQYQLKKNFDMTVDLKKYYGGAFGKNGNIRK